MARAEHRHVRAVLQLDPLRSVRPVGARAFREVLSSAGSLGRVWSRTGSSAA
jgi:hypothetical protein